MIPSSTHDLLVRSPVTTCVVTDFIQGGAGTSTNMNANEVIANLALESLGHTKGEYQYVNPKIGKYIINHSFMIPGLVATFVAVLMGLDPATGAGLPDTREGDLDIIYNVLAVKGLSLRFRNAYIGGGRKVVKDFRLIVNYELDLF